MFMLAVCDEDEVVVLWERERVFGGGDLVQYIGQAKVKIIKFCTLVGLCFVD